MCGYALTIAGIFLYSEAKRRARISSMVLKESAPTSRITENAHAGDATVVVQIIGSSSSTPGRTPKSGKGASSFRMSPLPLSRKPLMSESEQRLGASTYTCNVDSEVAHVLRVHANRMEVAV